MAAVSKGISMNSFKEIDLAWRINRNIFKI